MNAAIRIIYLKKLAIKQYKVNSKLYWEWFYNKEFKYFVDYCLWKLKNE